MSVSFTGVLTSVAYQFIVSESLPPHIYNTFLDNFVLFSFALMVLTVLENIVASLLINNERAKDSNRLDHMCQYAFPIMFVSGTSILAAVQLST